MAKPLRVGELIVGETITSIAAKHDAEQTTYTLTTENKQFEVTMGFRASALDMERYIDLCSTRLTIPLFIVVKAESNDQKYIKESKYRLNRVSYDGGWFCSDRTDNPEYSSKLDGITLKTTFDSIKFIDNYKYAVLTGGLEIWVSHLLSEFDNLIADVAGGLVDCAARLAPSTIPEKIVQVGFGRYAQAEVGVNDLDCFDSAYAAIRPYFNLYDLLHIQPK